MADLSWNKRKSLKVIKKLFLEIELRYIYQTAVKKLKCFIAKKRQCNLGNVAKTRPLSLLNRKSLSPLAKTKKI
jgi:hypothetical protein